MSLYKVLDNDVVSITTGAPISKFMWPVWIDGSGLCGYYYRPSSDYFYGTVSLDGKCAIINQTLSALEPRDLIYDETRQSTLIRRSEKYHFLAFDHITGLHLSNGWNDPDYVDYVNYYNHMKGKSKFYGLDSSGYVRTMEHGVKIYTTSQPPAGIETRNLNPLMQGNSGSSWNPMNNGNYLVIGFGHNSNGGGMQEYNPLTKEWVGPVYCLPESPYYYRAFYSKELNLVIAFYDVDTLDSSNLKVFALDTVPSSISNPETEDGQPIRGGEAKRIKAVVTGDRGEGVSGEVVNWSVGAGGGNLLYSTSETDDSGEAFNVYYPPAGITPPYDVQINVEASI